MGSVVFVVDDDPSVRNSLRRLFASVGLAVEVFPSAQGLPAETQGRFGRDASSSMCTFRG
jgi:FixJ family two-component response regulator